MRVKILASGSKGNCTVVVTKDTSIMIDVGINFQRIVRDLEEEKIDVNSINAILITHSHNDHIKGLKVLVKKTNVKVYVPLKMVEEIKEIIPIEYIEIVEDEFTIGTIDIKLVHTSHDTKCSVGYIMENNSKSIVYITDTGYINKRILEQIKDKSMYIIESNHDERMLMDGPYPYYLKQRVISDEGHLSNLTTAKYLLNLVGNNTEYIILAHISDNNNTLELAYNTTNEILINNGINKKIILAKQEVALSFIEV